MKKVVGTISIIFHICVAMEFIYIGDLERVELVLSLYTHARSKRPLSFTIQLPKEKISLLVSKDCFIESLNGQPLRISFNREAEISGACSRAG